MKVIFCLISFFWRHLVIFWKNKRHVLNGCGDKLCQGAHGFLLTWGVSTGEGLGVWSGDGVGAFWWHIMSNNIREPRLWPRSDTEPV